MIDETKCSVPIEPNQTKPRIKGPIFSIADMKSALNQMSLDKPSQGHTNFVIAGHQYCINLCSMVFLLAQQLSHSLRAAFSNHSLGKTK